MMSIDQKLKSRPKIKKIAKNGNVNDYQDLQLVILVALVRCDQVRVAKILYTLFCIIISLASKYKILMCYIYLNK
jgi:hypothetical protein